MTQHLQSSLISELTKLITTLSDTMDTTTAHTVQPLQHAPPASPKKT